MASAADPPSVSGFLPDPPYERPLRSLPLRERRPSWGAKPLRSKELKFLTAPMEMAQTSPDFEGKHGETMGNPYITANFPNEVRD